MSLAFTSNTLINSVKIRAQIPTNQVTFRLDDFLQLANEELVIGIIPTILQLHEDHYLYEELIPLVDNVSNYPVPYRAMGNKLRNVKFQDNNGSIFELVRIDEDRRTDFGNTTVQTTSGLRYYYMQGNEIVLWPRLSGLGTGSLLVNYYLRPNMLVNENRAGLITSINRATGAITIDDFPANFTSSITYDFIMARSPHKIIQFDIPTIGVSSGLSTVTFGVKEITEITTVADTLGSLNNTYFYLNAAQDSILYYVWYNVGGGGTDPTISGRTGIMVTVATNDTANTVATNTKTAIDTAGEFTTAINTNILTITNNNVGDTTDASDVGLTGFTITTTTQGENLIPTGLVVGDYIMQSEETIIPQLPTELHVILAQRVACRCLEALGDSQGLSNANTKLQEMEFKTGILIDNRVEGSPMKVVNTTGFIRRRSFSRRF